MDAFVNTIDRLNQARLIDYLEKLGDQVAVCGPDWRIVFVNDAWRKFGKENGAGERDFIGSNYLSICEEIEGAEKSHGDAVSAGLRQAVSGNDEIFSYIYPCNAPHERRWFRLNACKIGGETLLSHQPVILRNTNITDEIEFVPDYVRGQIEARIAHDVKTTLNAIVGNIQFSKQLLSQGSSQKLVEERLNDAEKAGWRVSEVLNHIVEQSRASSFGASTDLIDLSDLVEMSGQIFKHQYSDIVFSCESFIHPAVRLHADKSSVIRITENIVSNAFKYNKPGGSVHVTVDMNPEKGIVLRVADTGIGFDEAAKDRIFEPFAREQNYTEVIDGHGIGLSSASRLIASLEGALTVDSKVGSGSEFTVIFPTWRTVWTS